MTSRRGRGRWALLALTVVVAGPAGGCPEAEKIDDQTRREILMCGNDPIGDPQPVPAETFQDQGIAIDWDRLVPLPNPRVGPDRQYARSVLNDPASVEQVYHDATRGGRRGAQAAWSICVSEALLRGDGREAAKEMASLKCVTLASCSVQVKLKDSRNFVSGMRRLAVTADAFQDEAKKQKLKLQLIGDAATLISMGAGVTAGMGRAPAARGQPVRATPGARPAPRPAATAGSPAPSPHAGVAAGQRAARGVPRIHMGQQGKHIPGHNNYLPGRSVLRADPHVLATRAGTGTPVNTVPRGQPGFKERVQFDEIIGDFVKDGVATPTRNAIIHYGKDGIHIVPAAP